MKERIILWLLRGLNNIGVTSLQQYNPFEEGEAVLITVDGLQVAVGFQCRCPDGGLKNPSSSIIRYLLFHIQYRLTGIIIRRCEYLKSDKKSITIVWGGWVCQS